MASNEEIKTAHNFFADETMNSVVDSMLDAARKDEAVGFAEWVWRESGYIYLGNDLWYNEEDEDGDKINGDQLYTIFKNQNS